MGYKEDKEKLLTQRKAAELLASRIRQQKDTVIEAMTKNLCIVTASCKAAGIERSLFYVWYAQDLEFKKRIDDLENVVLDFAESKLLKSINDENVPAILFFLRTRGRSRGYTERTQTDITTNGESLNRLQITVNNDEHARILQAVSRDASEIEPEPDGSGTEADL